MTESEFYKATTKRLTIFLVFFGIITALSVFQNVYILPKINTISKSIDLSNKKIENISSNVNLLDYQVKSISKNIDLIKLVTDTYEKDCSEK